MEVKVWNNDVLKLDVNSIGLKGSPTWVSRIFSPEREKGEIVGDGLHDPKGTSRLLLDKLLRKDLLPV
jgi:electron transfer flavoprotein beta subunit